MPLDAFLKLDEPLLKGESTDETYADQIEILSFEQTVKRTLVKASGESTAQKKGTTECSAITLLKPVDASTPKLMESACKGTPYATATISLCQPSGKSDAKRTAWARTVYFEITLKEVHIARVRLVGDAGIHLPVAGAPYMNSGYLTSMGPIEEVDLAFQKIKWLYKGSTGTANLTGMWSKPERTAQI